MILKNKKESDLTNAVTLASKALELYSEVKKRKRVNSSNDGLIDKISKSMEVGSPAAVNIVMRMLTATFRIMKG